MVVGGSRIGRSHMYCILDVPETLKLSTKMSRHVSPWNYKVAPPCPPQAAECRRVALEPAQEVMAARAQAGIGGEDPLSVPPIDAQNNRWSSWLMAQNGV